MLSIEWNGQNIKLKRMTFLKFFPFVIGTANKKNREISYFLNDYRKLKTTRDSQQMIFPLHDTVTEISLSNPAVLDIRRQNHYQLLNQISR